jgi:uncharacterized protein
MIIDCHAHVFAFPLLKHPNYSLPWISAEQQIEIMDRKGIDKAVILPLSNAECGAEQQSFGEILYICEKYPGRFIPFCNLDPRLPRRPDLATVNDYLYILQQFKDLGAKGLGELIARMPWTDPLMLKMLEACEILNMPVTFHTIVAEENCYGVIDEIGLPLLEVVLKSFPNLNFLGHSPGFWNEISGNLTIEEKIGYPTNPVKPNGRLIKLMRKYPNLYGDISAGSGLNALKRDPEHAWKFIDEFQDRLLLGLDYCSIKNDMQHIEWLKKAKEEGKITDEVFGKITWKNANRVLYLGL